MSGSWTQGDEIAFPEDFCDLRGSKLVWAVFMNSVRTSKRTPHFTITKINWLTLFKEIIAVYSEKRKKLKQ
jgi:hypothetical protein